MALGRPLDMTNEYKQNVYSITLDMSGWDKTNIDIAPPMSGVITVYGTNDPGARTGFTDGNASLATNFTPIRAEDLSTGTLATTISAAGNYRVDINARFLRLTGGADVYRLIFQHSKVS